MNAKEQRYKVSLPMVWWVIAALVADVGWIAFWGCTVFYAVEICLNGWSALSAVLFVGMLLIGTGMNFTYAEIIRERKKKIELLSRKEVAKGFGLALAMSVAAVVCSLAGLFWADHAVLFLAALIASCLDFIGILPIYASIKKAEG